MKMKLPKKHHGAETTIFAKMTALALQENAANLSQGFPDDEIHPHLKKLLAEATANNYNQYAPMNGLPMLVETLIDFNQKRNISVSKDELTIIPGATYGIYTAIASIIEYGDEVIVLEPSYDSYVPAIETNGGKTVFVSLNEHFEADFEAIKKAITEKTKAIIINSPHNPTGKIWKKEDFEQLYQMIKDTEIMVISDEVYDLITFDENKFYSICHHPELKNRSFAIFSFGKMFHITGWKVGYILAPEELTNAFRSVHQYLCFSVNTPAQYALAKHLENFEVNANALYLQQKRDFFLSEMKDLPFNFTEKTEGSYFQLAKYNQISDLGDLEFSIWLTKECKVATIPLSAFYQDQRNTGFVRFCFAKKEETVLKAVENLKRFL
jgi:methionine aminotransferase